MRITSTLIDADWQAIQGLLLLTALLAVSGAIITGPAGLILVPVATIGMIYALGTSLGRLLMLCFGTMVMFGASPFGGTVRALFPVLLVVGIPFAWMSIRRRMRKDLGVMKNFRFPLVLLVLVPVVFLYVMAFYSTDVSSWIRDATTFVLIPIGVLYGIDAGLSIRPVVLQIAFTGLGILGAVAYFTTWLINRQQLPPSAALPLLSSSMIVIPIISMSLALYFMSASRARFFWAASAVFQMFLLVGAGGRSALIYCASMTLFFLIVSLKSRKGFWRTLVFCAAGAILAVSLFRVYTQLVGSTFLANRFDWFFDASLEAVENDASGQARIRSYRIMWESFLEKPFLGNGFGYSYPPAAPTDMDVYTLDTPLVYLAKFGMLGAAVIILAITGVVVGCVRASRGRLCRMQVVAMCGAVVIAWLATLPSGAPTEQKGFGIGLAVLVAMSLAWSRESGMRRFQERRCQPTVRPSALA